MRTDLVNPRSKALPYEVETDSVEPLNANWTLCELPRYEGMALFSDTIISLN